MQSLADLINKPLNRKEFEHRILEAAYDVPLLDAHWPQSDTLRRFIVSWMDLATYYQLTSDTEISVEVVAEYANFVRLLRELLLSHQTDNALVESAMDNLDALEAAMAEVVKNASANVDADVD